MLKKITNLIKSDVEKMVDESNSYVVPEDVIEDDTYNDLKEGPTLEEEYFKIELSGGKWTYEVEGEGSVKITKGEAQEIMADSDKVLTESKIKNIDKNFKDLFATYKQKAKNKESLFNERVSVVIKDVRESKNGDDSMNLQMFFTVIGETSNKHYFDQNVMFESIKDKYEGNESDFQELYRFILQLSFNGILTTEDETVKLNKYLN